MQSPISPSNELVIVWDPEVGRQNPSENKQLKLARSVTRGVIDRDLKPSSNEKKYVVSLYGVPFLILKAYSSLLSYLSCCFLNNKAIFMVPQAEGSRLIGQWLRQSD